jgi:hypothetical protein
MKNTPILQLTPSMFNRTKKILNLDEPGDYVAYNTMSAVVTPVNPLGRMP